MASFPPFSGGSAALSPTLRQILADRTQPYALRLHGVSCAPAADLSEIRRTEPPPTGVPGWPVGARQMREVLLDRVVSETADQLEIRLRQLRRTGLPRRDLAELRCLLRGTLDGLRGGLTYLVLPDPHSRESVLRTSLCCRTEFYVRAGSEDVQELVADVIDLACLAELYTHRWRRLVEAIPGGWRACPYLQEEMEALKTGQPLDVHPLIVL